MTKARHTANLVDTNGDVKATALDNVPASNDASALTTGTLPDARLSNQAKVVKGTSAPSNPQGGDLWYDTTTGINLLKVYNSTNAIWVATNVVSPIISSAGIIENTIASNMTLTGTNFGSGQGVMSFTPSGGSASTVNVTPTNDTSVTAAIPAAIYGQNAGTSIAITFQNAGGLTSSPTNVTVTAATTGGTTVTSGGYKYHTFTSSGNFVLGSARNVEYLIIAGGGSGGSYAGGGGAGGVLNGTKSNLSAATYAIVVGAGGTHTHGQSSSSQTFGTDGNNSTGLGETAIGGGGGGDGSTSGRVGGSGGGGTYHQSSHGGAGTSGQGNAGGNSNTQRSDPYASGGGGGRGGAGQTAPSNTEAGDGGAGTNSYSAWATATSTGDNGFYAGGGGAGVSGGGGYSGGGVAGGAGSGGGGAGGVGGSGMSAGDANTGGGGGSGGYNGSTNLYKPMNGGSGIVILRYTV